MVAKVMVVVAVVGYRGPPSGGGGDGGGGGVSGKCWCWFKSEVGTVRRFHLRVSRFQRTKRSLTGF